MKRIVKHGGLWLLIVGFSFVIVSDVEARPFRRRYRSNNFGGYTNYTGYNTNYGYSNRVTTATVTAPGVDVNAGPTVAGPAAAISTPGVGVNAGPGGAGASAPGVGVNTGRIGVGADANVRVRGQSPDVSTTPAP